MSEPSDPQSLSAEEKRALLKRMLAQSAAPTRTPIRPVVRAASLPPSFSQEAFWFIQNLDPGSTTLNQISVVRLSGPMEAAVLSSALTELVQRHEVLRSRFVSADGSLRVQPVSTETIPVIEETLSHAAAEELEAALGKRIDAEATTAFDLARGPLVRARLIHLPQAQHALVINWHHIVSDGRSTAVLFRELAAIYGALLHGRSSPLPALPIQFGDFAVWQRETLTPELASQLEHWKRTLAGVPPLELPTEHPRPAVRSTRGDFVYCPPLPIAVDRGLRQLAQEHRTTLYVVLQAALHVLFARSSGQRDFAVGTVFGGRRKEAEELIGPFANTLALRVDSEEDPTFVELIGRVGKVVSEAFAHSDVPFDKVVEALAPGRDLSRTPVFQVMVDLREYGGEYALGEARARPTLFLSNSAALCDLAVLFLDAPEGFSNAPAGLIPVLNFSRDLFTRQGAERIGAHLATLLEDVVAHPERRLSELRLVDARERARILELAPGPLRPLPPPVVRQFEAQASERPDAVALEGRARSWTYAQLDAQANRIAAELMRVGVGPNVPVHVALERGGELLAVLLGVMKSGGFFIIVDPSQAPERIAAIFDDCRPMVVITEDALRDRLPPLYCYVLDPAQWDGPNEGPGAAPNPGVRSGPSDPAYLAYTSGSTGIPKGVMVEQGALGNVIAALARSRNLGPGKRMLQLLSPAFDAALAEVLCPLVSGATLLLESKDNVIPSAEMLRLARERRVTTMNIPPTALAQLPVGELPDLDTIIFGGEPAAASVLERWAVPGRQFRNEYGPTEATLATTVMEWHSGLGDPHLGRPIQNLRCYVLDEKLEPVGIGLPGELYIGGVGVARGYWAREELTGEKFLPDPFSPQPGARLYRSGDRVKLREDGALEFLGREDGQVKIRGHRVELGEVESAVRALTSVKTAAVLAQEDAPGERRLVAYVVLQPGAPKDPAALRAELKHRLPEYMLPSAFGFLEALPLSSTGKVDRRALPALSAEPAHTSSEPPVTPTEQTLARLWTELLRVPAVGRSDNFFELGGHSLLATQLAAAILEQLQIEVPIRVLFQSATLEELARYVDTEASPGPTALLRARPPGSPPVASLRQQALWTAHHQGAPSDNVALAVRVRAPLDADALARSLGAAVARHEVLRTGLRSGGPSPIAFVTEASGCELRQLPAAAGTALEVGQRATATLRAIPFDLSSPPLLRAAVQPLDDGNWALILAAPRLTADGPSLSQLAHEVLAGEGPGAPGLQYSDFAAWEAEALSGSRLDQTLSHWALRLRSPVPPLSLGADLTGRGHGIGAVTPALAFSRELSDRARALAREAGVSLFALLETGFQALLFAHSGATDLPVVVPAGGRQRGEIQRMVGPFVNPLVLRATVNPTASFADLLAQLSGTIAEASAHQEVPFELVARELGLGEAQVAALMQVDFSVHEPPPGPAPSQTASSGPEFLAASASHPATGLSLTVLTAETFQAQLGYDPARWSAGRARQLVEQYARLLELACHTPSLPLDDLARRVVPERGNAEPLPPLDVRTSSSPGLRG